MCCEAFLVDTPLFQALFTDSLPSTNQLHRTPTCDDITFETEFPNANLIPVGEGFQSLDKLFLCTYVNL